ncbi:MAG TPA: DegV family protein [Clostridia bacterium]|nr:DegV family protein [Clostridia bacterium]
MIRIITDSAADMTVEEARAVGVQLVSLNIQFADRLYRQEEDPDFRNFYRLLENAKELPTTSQPSPEDYAVLYRQARDAGDSVVVVTLSSKLSGTLQSATMAKEMVEGAEVYLVDSLSAVIGQRLLVEHAVRLRDAGKSAQEIADTLQGLRNRVVVWAMLDTLTYLAKGGRMPKGMAALGQLLRIKPIIAIRDGVLAMVQKARGYPALLAQMAAGPDIDRDFPVYFGYTAFEDLCLKCMASARERFHLDYTGLFPVGGLIGAHVGPNCIAVGYISKQPVTGTVG